MAYADDMLHDTHTAGAASRYPDAVRLIVRSRIRAIGKEQKEQMPRSN